MLTTNFEPRKGEDVSILGNGERNLLWSLLWTGYTRYRKYTGAPHGESAKQRYLEFLGISESITNEGFSRIADSGAVTKEVENRLVWLLGPHGETILKAWRIKNEC